MTPRWRGRGRCVNPIHIRREIEISPLQIHLVLVQCLHFFLKSSKALRKLVKGFIIWSPCCWSPLLLSLPSSKSQLLQRRVIETFIVWCRESGGSEPGGSCGWGGVDHFYAFASPSQTCFIKESPRILCDISTDFNSFAKRTILGPLQLQHCIYDKDLRAVHHQSSAFLPSVLCNMMWSTTPWRLYEP